MSFSAGKGRKQLYEHDTPYHRIRITDNEGIRLLRFERNRQSTMYLDDPFETDCEYCGYVHVAMAMRPRSERTLVVGLGGASVVKRMWRDYPWMTVDAVELDAEVVEACRAFFELPEDERIRVFVADGRQYIETCKDTYDIIIIDAYDDDHVPRPLLTEEFMRVVRDRLVPGGVVVYNFIGAVYGQHSKPFRSLHRTASNVWANVWTFPIGIGADPVDKTRNIVMLASDEGPDRDELLERIASRVDGLVTVRGFTSFGDDLYRGKVRSGDVALTLDPPSGR